MNISVLVKEETEERFQRFRHFSTMKLHELSYDLFPNLKDPSSEELIGGIQILNENLNVDYFRMTIGDEISFEKGLSPENKKDISTIEQLSLSLFTEENLKEESKGVDK